MTLSFGLCGFHPEVEVSLTLFGRKFEFHSYMRSWGLLQTGGIPVGFLGYAKETNGSEGGGEVNVGKRILALSVRKAV